MVTDGEYGGGDGGDEDDRIYVSKQEKTDTIVEVRGGW